MSETRILTRNAAGSALAGFITSIVALLCLIGAAPAPAPSAVPSPASSASPRARFFQRGPQFVSIGAATTPRIRNEFRAGSTSGETSFEGWLGSETTIAGRYHVFSFTDYRSFSYEHSRSDPVATIGGTGFAAVDSFRIHEDQLESGGGVRIAPRVYLGASFLKRQETTGYPPLKGIGYTLMFAPSAREAITPYGWLTYEPNAGGIYQLPDGNHTALTYRGLRYRAGVLITEPHTRVMLDLGFAGENLNNRTNAPARASDSMFIIGIGTRF